MATKNSKNPTKAQGSKEIVPLRPVDFRLVKRPEGGICFVRIHCTK